MTLGDLIRSLEILEAAYGPGSLRSVNGRDVWVRGSSPVTADTPLHLLAYGRDTVPPTERQFLLGCGWRFVSPPEPAAAVGLWFLTERPTGLS